MNHSYPQTFRKFVVKVVRKEERGRKLLTTVQRWS